MRMVANADDIFLVDVERPLEFAGGRGETVEDKVLTDTIDPLAARRYTARYEVAPGPFAWGKWSNEKENNNIIYFQVST